MINTAKYKYITLDYDLSLYTPKFYNAYTGEEISNSLDSLSFENDIVIILNNNKRRFCMVFFLI